MKNLIKLRRVIFLFFMISGFALLHSCAVYTPSVAPVTLPDIVRMSNDKVPSKDIINEIKKSHTAYTLKASEYAKLQQQGVADSVVNYMLKTHINLIRHNQQIQDSYYWSPWYGGYWYGGLGYGWPYGYWGWNMRSPIIIRSDEGNHHDGSSHREGHKRK
jgi:hypothetical protein